ncbi:MAG: hypothetical protein Rhirs2KO_20350 [Rhizobiaceae bacterium]
MKKLLSGLLLLSAGAFASGCAPDFKEQKANAVVPHKFVACYSYGCRKRVTYAITQQMNDRFAAIMSEGKGSAEAERQAIRRAVAYYEDLSTTRIGTRDDPKSPIAASGKPGQMDCIDESTNTKHVLLYLQSRQLLAYHSVQPNTSRGLLIDGRYPHWTAVIKDTSGKKWAVDSWFEPGGGMPDVDPLDYWRTRGVMGER